MSRSTPNLPTLQSTTQPGLFLSHIHPHGTERRERVMHSLGPITSTPNLPSASVPPCAVRYARIELKEKKTERFEWTQIAYDSIFDVDIAWHMEAQWVGLSCSDSRSQVSDTSLPFLR
jgi:hypothetical protein